VIDIIEVYRAGGEKNRTREGISLHEPYEPLYLIAKEIFESFLSSPPLLFLAFATCDLDGCFKLQMALREVSCTSERSCLSLHNY